MKDHDIDGILVEIGKEEFPAPRGLVEQTRNRLHRSPLLPAVVGVGLGLQLLTSGAVQVYLFSTEASALQRAVGQAGSAAVAGILILLILMKRTDVATLLRRLETAVGRR